MQIAGNKVHDSHEIMLSQTLHTQLISLVLQCRLFENYVEINRLLLVINVKAEIVKNLFTFVVDAYQLHVHHCIIADLLHQGVVQQDLDSEICFDVFA